MREMAFLVIENDLETAGTIAEALESKGHSVFKATDGGQGVSMAEELGPSLIFLNLSTPGTNGLGICKTFKEIEALKNVPIILLTMREGKFDSMYKTLFGITGFMKKPITREAVLSKIESLMPDILGRKAPAAEEKKQPAGYTEGTAEEPPLFQDIEEPEELPEEGHLEEAPVFRGIEKAMEAPSFEEILEEGPPEKAPVFQSIEEVEESPPEEERASGAPEEEAPLERLPEEFAPVHAERSVARRKILVYSVSLLAAIGIILSVAYTMFIMEKDGGPPAGTGTSEKEVSTLLPPEPAQVETPSAGEALREEEAPAEAHEEAPEGPAPEAAEPAPPAAGAYYVQFGAFGVEANAMGLLRKLKEAGLEAFIHEGATRSGKPLYRVLLMGGLDSADAASAEAQNIRISKRLDAAVYKMAP